MHRIHFWHLDNMENCSWSSTCCACSRAPLLLQGLRVWMWTWKLLQSKPSVVWIGVSGNGPTGIFWKVFLVPRRCLASFVRNSLLGRHGEPGGEGKQDGQALRPDLRRLVLAGQAHHSAHAAVAGGRDPQEERLRPRHAAQRSSAAAQHPLRPLRPLQQQQLVGLHLRAQSPADLALHPQQQWPHLFFLPAAGPAGQPGVRDVLSRLQGLRPEPGRRAEV